MLSFLKKIFGATVPAEAKPATYKVETPKVAEFPFSKIEKPAKPRKKPAAKKQQKNHKSSC